MLAYIQYIHVMPLARCVRHANNDVQNDVPHSCTKPMHQIHAKNCTCSGYGQNSFSKLVFIQGESIRLVVSAAIIASPNACDAAATLIFGSSKVARNTRGPDGLRSLQSEDVNCTLSLHETKQLLNTRVWQLRQFKIRLV